MLVKKCVVYTLCMYASFLYMVLYMACMNMCICIVVVYDCLSLRLSVDVLHMDFEVVVAGELLVAQRAFSHGSVGIMGQFVSDQHLLQTKGQVTHLETHKEHNFNPLRKHDVVFSMFNIYIPVWSQHEMDSWRVNRYFPTVQDSSVHVILKKMNVLGGFLNFSFILWHFVPQAMWAIG